MTLSITTRISCTLPNLSFYLNKSSIVLPNLNRGIVDIYLAKYDRLFYH
ncbi:hypothetical protein DSUL_140108 [Desulfovibrionales bacterium]